MSGAKARSAMISVIQGTYAVSDREEDVMTTVLGSCVATCLFDPVAGVGGMNHFLLPEAGANGSRRIIYGAQAMELLINALLKLGARKDRMRAKLFGGSHVTAGLSDVGASNAEFAVRFLHDEAIPCIGQSLGGSQARSIRFWPLSGRVHQKLISPASATATLKPASEVATPTPNITLF